MAATEEDDLPNAQDVSSEDEDYSYEDDLSDTEMSLPGNGSGRRGLSSRKKSRGDYTEPLPLMEGEGRAFRVLGFNQNQRATFLQILMRFGFGAFDWKEFVPRMKGKTLQEIHSYGSLFMTHIHEGVSDSPNFSDGVPKECVRVDEVLVRVAIIELIEEKIEFASKNPGGNLFPEHLFECFPGLKGKTWKDEHDLLLLKAILKHGYARWQAMVEDKDIGLVDVVRNELNLPLVNGSFSGGVQMNDAATASHSTNGTAEPTKEGQPNPDYSAVYQVREMQRRMVDFIKKRYLLLEKALNAEYYLEQTGFMRQYVPANQAPEAEQKDPEISGRIPLDTKSILKELPVIEPIDPKETAYGNTPDRQDMAKLYNGMCRVVEENTLDFAQLYLGDQSAGSRLSTSLCQLETIYEDVHRILTTND